MRTAPPLTAPFFRSDGQARLLAELLITTGTELTIQELARRTGLAYSSTHREVARLVDSGLLIIRQVGQARVVSANEHSPLVGPVRQLLVVATGAVPLLIAEFADLPAVDSAFVFGSYAARASGTPGPAPADIDLMVIGTPDPADVYAACRRVEEQVGRPVNPTILTTAELRQDSGFLTEVRRAPTLIVRGTLPW